MADWDDVARLAQALPEVGEGTSYGNRAWRVRGKAFVWARPLGRAEVDELGDAAPTGPVLAARVPDVGARAALIAESPAVYLTTTHFAAYPVVLVRLDAIGSDELGELLTEAWACRAPRRLVAGHRPGD